MTTLQGPPREALWGAPCRAPSVSARAETALALAHHRLAEGLYDPTTWGLYEARPERLTFDLGMTNVRAPEWAGEDLRGKRLLILLEQGLGDEIQFARFAPWLQERTGAVVTLVCSNPLKKLFQGLSVTVRGEDEFLFDAYTQRSTDAWVLTMSIPARAGVTLANLPAAPYLSAPSLAPPLGKSVGVVTHGNPRHGNDQHRSLPAWAADDLRALPGAMSLHPEDTGARDFADTASIIASLDLVVTVDTAVAHLAGAMGKPVWVLLPAHRTDWRWMKGRATSPWYPTARLYRQKVARDWLPVIETIRRDLAART